MRLNHLIEALPAVLGRVGGDAMVHGIAADSRRVRPGDLFVAIPGVNVDGHRFIAEAVTEGAVAVVGERPPQKLPGLPWGAFTYVRVPNAREAWGWLCAARHDFPSRKMTLVGVTGTDGKTTTVNLVYAILRAAGINAGMVSTVNAHIGEEEIDTGLHTTTPDPPDVQRYLARMVEAGTTHAVLEVTSHGLAQHRVAGCDFDVAAVTNVTHEHLDFHGSLSAYQRAKASLFEELTRSFRKSAVSSQQSAVRTVPKMAILNRDDDSFRYLSLIPADQQVVYAVTEEADVTARDVRFTPERTRFILRLRSGQALRLRSGQALRTPDGEIPIETPLVGEFNVSNVLAAAAVGVALGFPLETIAEGIAVVRGVPGRMERIDEGQDFLAIVDFAHTPNALQRALETARAMTGESGRVIVAFGCAGLRDQAKREMMGHVAGRLADLVVITAEDPRTESLEEIMAESAAAAMAEGKREGVDLWCVPDRGEALLFACQVARKGDVVIACGKGHEQSMCFGTTEYPWDDREALRRALHGETLDTLPTMNNEPMNSKPMEPSPETVGGGLFYTVSQGPADSPALVLVHGAGGNHLHWPAELRRLHGATVYTLDLPGHGRSGGQGCDNIEDYTKATVEFLNTVGIGQPIIVGHSMGGATALTLALHFPTHVAGLVLMATGARLRVARAILEGIHSDFEGSVELITRFAWSLEAKPALTELGRQALLETGPDVLFDDFTACDRFDVMERLGEIKIPTLVIAGTADQLTPPKFARFLAEHIPNAHLVLVEDAGHMVMLERPLEVMEAVQEFLGKTSNATR